MKTPKKKPADNVQFCFRSTVADLERYRKQAESEGFRNVTAWIVWHLAKICREEGKE